MPRAASSVLLVKAIIVPRSVQANKPKHIPSTAKHPAVEFIPFEKVELAAAVFNIEEPVIVNPLELDNPAVDIAPVKVDVPFPVTARLVVVALVVVELVATNPSVVRIPDTLALPVELRYAAEIPEEKVEVAADVLRSDPPLMAKPLEVDKPAVDMPPVNVEVPAPVTVKLTV